MGSVTPTGYQQRVLPVTCAEKKWRRLARSDNSIDPWRCSLRLARPQTLEPSLLRSWHEAVCSTNSIDYLLARPSPSGPNQSMRGEAIAGRG